jgi:putative SOS response-associated peptidase YedK
MCGRYRLSRRKQLIEEYFEAAGDADWEPRYNIAPTQNVPVIRQDATEPIRRASLTEVKLAFALCSLCDRRPFARAGS